MSARAFPFSAVVGQEQAKLALQLVAVDARIGGVLLRGEKGSAKTTLARGLAALLGDGSPFVDLPLGATEDRLIGTLDLAVALTEGRTSFRPGLLAAADGGVLYVDEVNLLADHLVDILLDVCVSGVNRVEREGIAHTHPARFVLIGSMNPEEGELRPQLLDRFGLCVDVRAPVAVADRTEIVRRRLRYDRDDGSHLLGQDDGSHLLDGDDQELAARLAAAQSARVEDDLIARASRLALAVGAEGMRADVVLCRAAAALAGLDGRHVTGDDDLRTVAPLVLAHRSRRSPFDPPMLSKDELDEALDDAFDQQPPPEPGDGGAAGEEQPIAMGAHRRPPRPIGVGGNGPSGRSSAVEGPRGRLVRDVAAGDRSDLPISVAGSVRQLAGRRIADPEAVVEADDLRVAVREEKAGSLLVLAVDISGSMGAQARAEAATGTVLGLLTDAYQRRDHVAMVTFRAGQAEVVLRPTGSVEVARRRLSSLTTGGDTPLAEGIQAALALARTASARSERAPVLVLLTDGRATGSPDAFDAATRAAEAVRASGVSALVLDCETGAPRLGLARRLAETMGAACVPATELTAAALTEAIRTMSDVARWGSR